MQLHFRLIDICAAKIAQNGLISELKHSNSNIESKRW